MKIEINGDIIDTTLIYKITDIAIDNSGAIYFRFYIHMFNHKKLEVVTDSFTYYDGNHTSLDFLEDKDKPYPERRTIDNYNDGKIEDCLNHPPYKSQLNKIKKVRSSIIRIWSDNQSVIEQFTTN